MVIGWFSSRGRFRAGLLAVAIAVAGPWSAAIAAQDPAGGDAAPPPPLVRRPAAPVESIEVPPPPAVAGQDPEVTPQVLGTIEEVVREELRQIRAESPAPAGEALRTRLTAATYRVFNEALDLNLPEANAASLPPAIRAEADRMVAALLDDPAPAGPAGTPADGQASERLKPWVEAMTEILGAERAKLVARKLKPAAVSKALVALAREVAAQAADVPGGDPAGLSPEERAFAEALGRRVAKDGIDPASAGEAAINARLKALAELVRRRNIKLMLDRQDEPARLASLGAFAREKYASVAGLDRPDQIDAPVVDRIDALVTGLVQGGLVPIAQDGSPDIPDPTIGEDGDRPEGGRQIAPALRVAILGLARGIDRALTGLGLDRATRRATLLKFVLERLATKTGLSDPGQLDPDAEAEAVAMVDDLLDEAPEPTAPNPWTLRPIATGQPVGVTPYVTIPMVPTAPAQPGGYLLYTIPAPGCGLFRR